MGGTHLNQPVVGIAATPTGKGYWLVASDGGVFSFGDAHFRGSMGGVPLAQPVVGIAATASGSGYYMVATDGGVFTFGNARFHDAGLALGEPVVGMAVQPNGDGYWLVTAMGHVVAFGKAPPLTDAIGADVTKPIVGIAATKSGKGYWLAGRGTAPVYFLRGEHLGAATRDVHQGAAPDAAVNVMRDLFAGPTAAERAAGLTTAIPAGSTVLRRVGLAPRRDHRRLAAVRIGRWQPLDAGTRRARLRVHAHRVAQDRQRVVLDRRPARDHDRRRRTRSSTRPSRARPSRRSCPRCWSTRRARATW